MAQKQCPKCEEMVDEAKALTVAVDAWDDLKTVEVPFQATVPIGVAAK